MIRLGLKGGVNLYRYVASNPTNSVDPSGTKPSTAETTGPYYVVPEPDGRSKIIWPESGKSKVVGRKSRENGSCGPEIGRQLRTDLFRLKQRWESSAWNNNQKAKACDALTRIFPNSQFVAGSNSWEITDFPDKAWLGEGGTPTVLTNYPMCATGSCKNTVSVFSKCHKSAVANYILYGFLFELCRTGYSLQNILQSQGYAKYVIDAARLGVSYSPMAYRNYYYSPAAAQRWTATYKTFMSGTDKPVVLAWVKTGSHFKAWANNPWLRTPTDSRYPGSLCRPCSKK